MELGNSLNEANDSNIWPNHSVWRPDKKLWIHSQHLWWTLTLETLIIFTWLPPNVVDVLASLLFAVASRVHLSQCLLITRKPTTTKLAKLDGSFTVGHQQHLWCYIYPTMFIFASKISPGDFRREKYQMSHLCWFVPISVNLPYLLHGTSVCICLLSSPRFHEQHPYYAQPLSSEP